MVNFREIDTFDKCMAFIKQIEPDIKNNKYRFLHLEVVFFGYLEILRILVTEHNWNIYVKDAMDDDIYTIAMIFNQKDIMTYLTKELGWDIYSRDDNGLDIVLKCVKYNEIDKVETLFKNYMFDASSYDGQRNNCAHYASSNNNLEMVKLLQKYGVDFCKINNYRIDGYQTALIKEHMDIVEYLDKNSCIYSTMYGSISRQRTYLHVIRNDSFEGLKYLIEVHGLELKSMDMDNNTIFLQCVKQGNLKMIKYLLDNHKPNLEYTNYNGENAYLLAVFGGHIEIMKYFETNNKSMLNIINAGGNGAFLLSVIMGNLEVVKHLLEAGFKHDILNKRSENALILAAKHKRVNVFKYLIKNYTYDVNHKTTFGLNVYSDACVRNAYEIMEYLENNYDDTIINVEIGSNKDNLYLYAIQNNNFELMKRLDEKFDGKFDRHKITFSGYDALLLAAEYDNVNAVKYLDIKYNWDFSVKTNKGGTIESIAKNSFCGNKVTAFLESRKRYCGLNNKLGSDVIIPDAQDDICLICIDELEKDDKCCCCVHGHISHKKCLMDYFLSKEDAQNVCIYCSGKMLNGYFLY